jgi:ketosteroid isomerase-like protein
MDERSERALAEASVLEANQEFYSAFDGCDFAAMSLLWAERVPVACIHPGRPALSGRAAVLESWQQILESAGDWNMSCHQARVYWMGQSAFVTCLEASGKTHAHLIATNVFVLEDGRWRMTHHHAGPLSEPIPTTIAAGAIN